MLQGQLTLLERHPVQRNLFVQGTWWARYPTRVLRRMAPHPTSKAKSASSAAANGRGDRGEGEGLRTPIKEEPVDEDTVGSTTVTVSLQALRKHGYVHF